MSDPTPAATQGPDLSTQLTRSLTAVWNQNAGAKPSATKTELTSERLKFELADAVAGPPAEPVGEDEDPRGTDSVRYRNEAIAAVRRITGRKVLGFIPVRNAKTDVASDVYILERPRVAR